MQLFGLPVENVMIVDIRDDGTGRTMYRVRYQYVSRKTSSMFWLDWLYAEDVPEIFGQTAMCAAAVNALLEMNAR